MKQLLTRNGMFLMGLILITSFSASGQVIQPQVIQSQSTGKEGEGRNGGGKGGLSVQLTSDRYLSQEKFREQINKCLREQIDGLVTTIFRLKDSESLRVWEGGGNRSLWKVFTNDIFKTYHSEGDLTKESPIYYTSSGSGSDYQTYNYVLLNDTNAGYTDYDGDMAVRIDQAIVSRPFRDNYASNSSEAAESRPYHFRIWLSFSEKGANILQDRGSHVYVYEDIGLDLESVNFPHYVVKLTHNGVPTDSDFGTLYLENLKVANYRVVGETEDDAIPFTLIDTKEPSKVFTFNAKSYSACLNDIGNGN